MFSPIGGLSKLLEKMGLTEYVDRVSFAAHFFTGVTFALAGALLGVCDAPMWRLWLGHGLVIAWTGYTIIDELFIDGHWRIIIGGDPEWRDFLWDIGSKLAGSAGYLIWVIA